MAEDEAAYAAYRRPAKLPRGTDEEKRARSRAVQRALRGRPAAPGHGRGVPPGARPGRDRRRRR